jgi:hypothetical protein
MVSSACKIEPSVPDETIRRPTASGRGRQPESHRSMLLRGSRRAGRLGTFKHRHLDVAAAEVEGQTTEALRHH